jgi:hypothetical protein
MVAFGGDQLAATASHRVCVCTENLIRIDLLTESLTVGRNVRSNTDFAANLVSIVRVFERPHSYLVDRLCVPKIRFCSSDDEGRRGQAVT